MAASSSIWASSAALLCSFAASACLGPGPGEAEAPRTESFVLDAPGGVSLAITDRGRTRPVTGEITLVFLHGLACDQESLAPLAEAFAADHRVVSFDGVGHGRTRGSRAELDLDSYAADAALVLEALALERVVFVGHSLGGPVALLATARVPERVLAIIGLDTLHDLEWRFPAGMLDELLAALDADFAGTMERQIRAMYAVDESSAGLEATIATARRTDPQSALRLIASFESFRPAAAARAANRPLHCINAAAGQPTRSERNRELAPAGYRAELIAGAGHFLHASHPAEVRRAIAAALERIRADSAGTLPTSR